MKLVEQIEETVGTCHQHHHIIYDIAKSYPEDYLLNYLEIGCGAGASACLMLQRPNTNVTTIDTGVMVDQVIAIQNMDNHNPHKNKFSYIKGDSHLPEIRECIEKKVDILFIDGDHSFYGVISDFNLYQDLVLKGGYIIFDDYSHFIGCPEIKGAVDSLNLEGYEIIGTIDNVLGARGVAENNTKGNCFIIRKL